LKNILLYIIILILILIIIYQDNTKKEIPKETIKTVIHQKVEKCQEQKDEESLEVENKIELTDQEAISETKESLKLSRVDRNGVSIVWSIDTNNTDEYIKLIALLSKNNIQDKKVFKFKVTQSKEKKETENEIAKKLTPDFIKLDNESLDEVTSNLNLPEIGADGSKIVWQSDNPNIVTNKGVVIHPSFNKDEETVTLRATIYKDGEEIEKEFSITVMPDESEIREVK